MLIDDYHQLNSSFGNPLIFRLTERGFFSEVTNLVTAILFGLVEQRRLIVDATAFNGLAWGDFYQASLPGSELEGAMPAVDPAWVIDGIRSEHFSTVRNWIIGHWREGSTLAIPQLDLVGSVFELKRALSLAFCAPRRKIRRDAEKLMRGASLRVGQFAAFHVRRGDKTQPVAGPAEGDATLLSSYMAKVRELASAVKDVFVLTDDFTVLESFRRDHPDFRLSTLCPSGDRGHREGEFNSRPVARKRDEITRLVIEAEVAAASAMFVGGFLSNVALYIANVHRNPDRCVSIDRRKQWVPA